jgi:hypothetical protein
MFHRNFTYRITHFDAPQMLSIYELFGKCDVKSIFTCADGVDSNGTGTQSVIMPPSPLTSTASASTPPLSPPSDDDESDHETEDNNHPSRYKHIRKTKDRQYQCRKCKQFKRKFYSAVLKHVNGVHLKKTPFRCTHDGCGKQFQFAHKLNEHLLSHTNIREYRCDLCNESFKYPRNLTDHIQTQHMSTAHKQIKCGILNCLYRCWNNSDLRKHQRHKHLKERAYECSRCFKKFSHKKDYHKHTRSESSCERYLKRKSLKANETKNDTSNRNKSYRLPSLAQFVASNRQIHENEDESRAATLQKRYIHKQKLNHTSLLNHNDI